MSSSTKSADLAELKTLRTRLSNWDKAKKDIQDYESKIYNLRNKTDDSVYYHQEPTNRYEDAYRRISSENSVKSGKVVGSVMTIAVVILIAMVIGWLILSGKLAKNTYLYTPEIVKEYTGTYYTSSEQLMNAKLKITSCDEDGYYEGSFVFYGTETFSGNSVKGEYTVTGKIKTKSREGYVTASMAFDNWVEKPDGYVPLNSMVIKIYNDCQVIRGLDYSMALYSADYVREPVADLYTPEILQKEYTGKRSGYTGTLTIVLDSCAQSGYVQGQLKYEQSNGTSTWKLSGMITEKYSDGTVVLQLEAEEESIEGFRNYYPSTIVLRIYDDGKSYDCSEGMQFFYEDEGFKKDPEPAKTPVQKAVKRAAPIVLPAYIVLVIVILAVLSKKNMAITPEQQSRLNQLMKQDNENRAKNEIARKRALEQARKDDQRLLADYRQLLEGAKQREKEASYLCSQTYILSDKDKSMEKVNFLIEKMESGRADSLKEALILLDADIQRRHDSWLRAELAHQESMRRMQAEAEARRDQMYHNLNVEYQQRRQADELEKIRKALED